MEKKKTLENDKKSPIENQGFFSKSHSSGNLPPSRVNGISYTFEMGLHLKQIGKLLVLGSGKNLNRNFQKSFYSLMEKIKSDFII